MILVDPAVWPWRGRRWAHLVSDAHLSELHDFAARLGLRRLAFQGDHYDIDEPTRLRALELGASPVSSRELVGRLRRAGLRRRGAAAPQRWQLVHEWSLDELESLAIEARAAIGGAADQGVGAGGPVVRVLSRSGERALVVVSRGPGPEDIVVLAERVEDVLGDGGG